MPIGLRQIAGGRALRPATATGALVLLSLLAGCMGSGEPGATMSGGAKPTDLAPLGQMQLAASDKDERGETRSVLIDELIARNSVLPDDGPFAQVAQAVLLANRGSAAAELRVARLKAEARSKNWLPSIGPTINLTSLGATAASILVDQVLFDNGRRKAERDFAAADVELAAVSLSSGNEHPRP